MVFLLFGIPAAAVLREPRQPHSQIMVQDASHLCIQTFISCPVTRCQEPKAESRTLPLPKVWNLVFPLPSAFSTELSPNPEKGLRP